jgi:hypothetical protein
MKIFVYLESETGDVSCEKSLLYLDTYSTLSLIQTIEVEPTDLTLTDTYTTTEIQVGEVFNCNSVVPNLIRTA